jgi:hypothetical protein
MILRVIRLLIRVPYTSWDTTTILKMGPTIVAGSAKAQGSRQNPLSWVRAAQSNQSEGQSDAKGD